MHCYVSTPHHHTLSVIIHFSYSTTTTTIVTYHILLSLSLSRTYTLRSPVINESGGAVNAFDFQHQWASEIVGGLGFCLMTCCAVLRFLVRQNTSIEKPDAPPSPGFWGCLVFEF